MVISYFLLFYMVLSNGNKRKTLKELKVSKQRGDSVGWRWSIATADFVREVKFCVELSPLTGAKLLLQLLRITAHPVQRVGGDDGTCFLLPQPVWQPKGFSQTPQKH